MTAPLFYLNTMAYPNLSLPRPYIYFDENLDFILQTESAAAAVTINVFAAADTGFATSLYSDTATTDANGDLTDAVAITDATDFPVGEYVLRVGVGAGPTYYTADFAVTRTSVYLQLLDSLLGGLKYLPREERAEISLDNLTARFGFGNWQLSPAPRIDRDDNEVIDGSLAKLDYTNGKLYFLSATTNGTDLRARYRMAYISDAEEYLYLRQALNQVNSKAPATNYSLSTAPVGYEAPVALGAYRAFLKRFIFDLGTFKYRVLFPDPASLLSSAQAMYASTQAEFDSMLANVKRRGLLLPNVVVGNDIARTPAQADGVNFRNFSLLA